MKAIKLKEILIVYVLVGPAVWGVLMIMFYDPYTHHTVFSYLVAPFQGIMLWWLAIFFAPTYTTLPTLASAFFLYITLSYLNDIFLFKITNTFHKALVIGTISALVSCCVFVALDHFMPNPSAKKGLIKLITTLILPIGFINGIVLSFQKTEATP